MRAGDVIVMRNRWKPWHLLIPGYWTHAAIYVGEGFVIEARESGVEMRGLDAALRKAKKSIIMRARFASEEQVDEAVLNSRRMVGLPYDFLFSESNHSVYCSEMVWLAYKRACGEAFPMERRRRLWRKTITPSDIVRAKSYFSEVKENTYG